MLLLFLFPPLLLLVLSVPLVLRRVPRNTFYGMRTTRSMQGTDADWYRINRMGGLNFLYAAAADLLVVSALRLFGPFGTAQVAVLVLVLLGLVLMAVVATLRQS